MALGGVNLAGAGALRFPIEPVQLMLKAELDDLLVLLVLFIGTLAWTTYGHIWGVVDPQRGFFFSIPQADAFCSQNTSEANKQETRNVALSMRERV